MSFSECPPHSELLRGYDQLTSPEEQIAFLYQAMNHIIRSTNCRCLYCTGKSDNPLLVFEQACRSTILPGSGEATDRKVVQDETAEASKHKDQSLFPAQVYSSMTTTLNVPASSPLPTASKSAGSTVTIRRKWARIKSNDEAARRSGMSPKLPQARRRPKQRNSLPRPYDARRLHVSPFSFSVTPHGELNFHGNAEGIGPGVPVATEHRLVTKPSTRPESKPQLDYGLSGQREILAEELVRRSQSGLAPGSRTTSPQQPKGKRQTRNQVDRTKKGTVVRDGRGHYGRQVQIGRKKNTCDTHADLPAFSSQLLKPNAFERSGPNVKDTIDPAILSFDTKSETHSFTQQQTSTRKCLQTDAVQSTVIDERLSPAQRHLLSSNLVLPSGHHEHGSEPAFQPSQPQTLQKVTQPVASFQHVHQPSIRQTPATKMSLPRCSIRPTQTQSRSDTPCPPSISASHFHLNKTFHNQPVTPTHLQRPPHRPLNSYPSLLCDPQAATSPFAQQQRETQTQTSLSTAAKCIESASDIGPVAPKHWPAPIAPMQPVAPNVWVDRVGLKWTRNWSGEWERYKGS